MGRSLQAGTLVTGAAGPTGPTGAAGDTGLTGPTGPTGLSGEGAVGPTGPAGVDGTAGTTGPTGPQGPQGESGDVGPTGPTGPQGDTGATGATGADSTVAGPTGAQGDTGATGADSTVAGPTGAQGDTGPTGADSTVAGPTGTQGDVGTTGAQGDVGPTGAQGDVGPTGTQGDVGTTGAQGDVGPTGAQGDVGPTGTQGDVGTTGAQGDVGPTGPTGTQGDVGPTGPTGASGDVGTVGPTGATGADSTVAGPTGPTGAQGDAGTVGPTGATPAIPATPTNQFVPVITGGAAEEGVTLTVSNGGWTGVVPIEFTYQWQRVTTNIAGATLKTYVLVAADVGNTVRCVVTATSAGGAASVNTANTDVVVGPPAIGDAFGGGFFAGAISTTANGVATHYLIVGPLSTALAGTTKWKTSNTTTSGTTSDIDGPGNTAAMISAGAAAHPCAQFCNNLTIGGFSDFYMPAKNELEVCFFNLTPLSANNNTNSGINPNAVPARASNYTSGNPAQTSAAAFKSGGAQAFPNHFYWCSTEASAANGRLQDINAGLQTVSAKSTSYRVRAVRRVAV